LTPTFWRNLLKRICQSCHCCCSTDWFVQKESASLYGCMHWRLLFL